MSLFLLLLLFLIDFHRNHQMRAHHPIISTGLCLHLLLSIILCILYRLRAVRQSTLWHLSTFLSVINNKRSGPRTNCVIIARSVMPITALFMISACWVDSVLM